MSRVACIVLLLFLACAGLGCSVAEPYPPFSIIKQVEQVEAGPTTVYDFTGATTVGNHSFLLLNLPGNPPSRQGDILKVLGAFEKEKGVEIISFQIEKQQQAYYAPAIIWGIWVTHRPKT